MASSHTSSPADDFFAQNPSCHYIRYQWVDYSGILRARVLTKKHCLELASQGKAVRCPDICFQCTPTNVALWLPLGVNHLLYPDWSSLRLLQPSSSTLSYAAVMCFVEGLSFHSPIPNLNLCPRLSLKRILGTAREAHGMALLLGFEIEFYVLRRQGASLVPAVSETVGYYPAAGLRDPVFQHIEEVMCRLSESGIHFQACHIEGAHGQYEIVLDPLPPMQAVDELVAAQDIIKSTIASKSLIATMTPRPLKGRPACGIHAHISTDTREHDEAFLAGILTRLPELCAVTLPYEHSYTRLRGYEAGQKVCWGTENRMAPIRKIKDGHWEFRCLDATSNPYLALSAIIAAGLSGIGSKMELSWRDMSYQEPGDAAWTAAKDLPAHLDQSLQSLQDSLPEWETMLQSDILERYTRLKRAEVDALSELADAQLIDMLVKWF